MRAMRPRQHADERGLGAAGGKNIMPKNIESAPKNHSAVGECVAIGDRREYLTMVFSLDPEATPKWKADHAQSGAPHECAELGASIQKQVDEVNEKLARIEQVKKFTLSRRRSR